VCAESNSLILCADVGHPRERWGVSAFATEIFAANPSVPSLSQANSVGLGFYTDVTGQAELPQKMGIKPLRPGQSVFKSYPPSNIPGAHARKTEVEAGSTSWFPDWRGKRVDERIGGFAVGPGRSVLFYSMDAQAGDTSRGERYLEPRYGAAEWNGGMRKRVY